MSISRSRSSSSCSGSSNISMPLLEKEVEESPPVDGGTNPESANPCSSTSTVPSVDPADPSSSSSEYDFRIQLLNNESNSGKEPFNNEDDQPPPISPSSTAFDPFLREGQVKIIRMGDTMHVMTYEPGGKPSITSYAKPLSSSSWHDDSSRPQFSSTTRPDLSPLRTDFKFDGESAIRTISRYCFPSCTDTQLDHLTLQEILSAAQTLTEKWVNARDSGLDETQRSFLKTQFIPSKLETVLLKDWETVCEIFEAHHEWKEDQLMFGIEPPTVADVNYGNASCLKTLPRVSRVTAKKRKELLKNYEPFVDLGQRVDLRGLRRKRGSSSTFVLNTEKISALLEKSQYYGTRSSGGGDVLTSNSKKSPKKQESQQKSTHKMTVGPKSAKQKGIKSKMGNKNMSDNNNTLNPRRDKPMAKIRSQVRKVDRLARLNGESFHEAALTLSKNSGLGTTTMTMTNRRTDDGGTIIQSETVNHNVSCSTGTQQDESSSSVPPNSTAGIVGNSNNNTLETELDLGLEGVCFDADVAELTNSVMDGNVLEDLDNLVQNPSIVFNAAATSSTGGTETSAGGGNSMVEALHAGIDYVRGEEFSENFGGKNFQDIIVSSMEVEDDDGLLDAIDTTLSLENLIHPPSSLSTTNSAAKATDIFDMTGLSASEECAFDSLATAGGGQSAASGQAVVVKPSREIAATATNPSSKTTTDGLKTEIINHGKDKTQMRVDESGNNSDDKETPVASRNPHEAKDTGKIMIEMEPEETDPVQDDDDDDIERTEPVSAKKLKLDTKKNKKVVRSRKSAPADMGNSNRDQLPSRRDRKVSAKKTEALLNCTLTGSYWQIPENKHPANRPKRANAGALMATKSSTRNRDSSETRTTRDNKEKEKSAPPTTTTETKAAKRAPRTAARSNSTKPWCKKYSSDAYTNSPITPDGMIVSKQTALRSIVSIPDSICPTSHEEFLLKHRRCFGEDEMKEIYELMGKARPKIEASSKKSGMDRYLKKLTTKPTKAPSPPLPPAAEVPEIKTEPPAATTEVEQPSSSSSESISLSSSSASGPAAATVAAATTTATLPPTKPTPVTQPAPKPKAYSARSKRFEEDEKSEIVKLEGNQILVDGNIIVNINHEDYIREKDFEIPYDDHEFSTTAAEVKETVMTTVTATTSEETVPSENVENKEIIPPKNIICSSTCKLPYCTLGCVCHSLHPATDPKDSANDGETTAKHCGKVKCMLECSCNTSLNTDDADIRSRLRPRVSMLDWNTRLNNYEAYISPDKDRDSLYYKGGDQRPAMSQYSRFKRNVIAPKRNSDFISHSASKKLEGIRPLTRQTTTTTKLSPFKTIGNRLQRMKQRQQQQQLLRPLKHTNSNEERRVIRLKKNGGTDDDDVRKSKLGDRGPRSRAGYSSDSAKPKRKLVPGVDYSLEGTGPPIPPELMARFAPFMEIRYCPKPDKLLPLVSESEDESSDDDENDDEYASLANLLNQASSSVMKPEDSIPVIVSYRSCQEGLSDDVICPPCPTPTS